MSRIIVKELPKYFTEDNLKAHFLKRLQSIHKDTTGLLTDVKILKNRQGESRRFAFVGYKLESDAFDAVNYFDGSFIDTSRINVSMAKSFADSRVPIPMRERKKNALKRLLEKQDILTQSQAQKKQKITDTSIKRHNMDAEIANNKQLQEFIETIRPSNKVTSWEIAVPSSDQIQGTGDVNGDGEANPLLMALNGMENDKNVLKIPENESDEEYIDFKGAARVQDVGKKENGETILNPNAFDVKSENLDKDHHNLAQDKAVSDLDWLRARRAKIKEGGNETVALEDQKEDKINVSEQTDGAKNELFQEEQTDDAKDELFGEEQKLAQIRSTRRLFLRNILYSATEDDFRDLFSSYGELEEVHVALDTRTGESKGFAYVLFKSPEDAVNAYLELDKQIFQGRLLHILPADAKKSHRLNEFDLKNLPLKKQRELERKSTANQQIFSWNSLYMNQNAIIGSVAAKLGVEKRELIDPKDTSSAVKQALAEAHVIGDVRKFFKSRGVDLAKFSEFTKLSERDDRVLLIKNFPYGTTQEDLAELFLPFGKLERLLMPPSGTIAIAQYRDVTSARSAFTKLSYKRFRDGIIYIEKGPKDCFKRPPMSDEIVVDRGEDEQNTSVPVKEIKDSVGDFMERDETDTDVVNGTNVSIFVKNLNFSTTSQDLTSKFQSFSGFIMAQVKMKPDYKHPDKTLSMGFGFLQFRTKEDARVVISEMDGAVIHGHKIQLKLSDRKTYINTESKSTKKKNTGKIIIKNLSFEATRKDIFELFSSFGQLRSVRVPKKLDKSARGFAFVEFLIAKEAETAMDQLQGVHLLGRRLVMQYAEQESNSVEDQIEKITKKMKRQVASVKVGEMRKNGKIKLDQEYNDQNDGLHDF